MKRNPPFSDFRTILLLFSFPLIMLSCHSNPQKNAGNADQATGKSTRKDSLTCCTSELPARIDGLKRDSAITIDRGVDRTSREGMVLISGGQFVMGGDTVWGRSDEFPLHQVRVSSFYMDIHEVTNAQFLAFTRATGYVTMAERKPDWEEIKKQVPPGTPRPAPWRDGSASPDTPSPIPPVQEVPDLLRQSGGRRQLIQNWCKPLS